MVDLSIGIQIEEPVRAVLARRSPFANAFFDPHPCARLPLLRKRPACLRQLRSLMVLYDRIFLNIVLAYT